MLAGTFQTKAGVSLVGAGPEILSALSLAAPVFQSRGVDLVVTSVTEGRHIAGSLHPVGRAVDLRTRELRPGEARAVAAELQARLGAGYQVILESDHVHIEFDPGGGGWKWTPWDWSAPGARPGSPGGLPSSVQDALPVLAVAGALALALA